MPKVEKKTNIIDFNLARLKSSMVEVLSRPKLDKSHQIAFEELSTQDRIQFILSILSKKNLIGFYKTLQKSEGKIGVVVSFLASLELAKDGCIDLIQNNNDLAEIKVGLNNLEERHAESSLELSEVASGFRLQIKKDFTHLLSSLWTEKSRLSKSLMETISIIAYKQPVTRGEIEEIRGVQVSTNIIRNLLERDWVKISGYKETPGRPALLVTTKTFLNDLNIKKISDLPTLPEKEEISPEEITDNAEINLEAG